MLTVLRTLSGYFPVIPVWALYLCGAIVSAAVLLGFVSVFAGVTSWVERRIAGRMMARIGPNRVGPQGSLQWLADGVKLFLKEDIVPQGADGILFRLAPYFVFAGMFGTFVVLPFGANLAATDLDVGIFFAVSITALVVVGIILGGWSSNSKWSLFGGLRSAAQILSYEIPVGLCVLIVVLLTGALSTQAIVEAQGGMPWDWFVFHSPFSFVAFFVFFTATIAEGNRTPFDLPEAESELVAGYCTEYSGFRFVVFFFAEWANLWVMSSLATLAFLGGWQIPFIAPAVVKSSPILVLLSLAIFVMKTLTLVFIVIQLRWTVPRLRIDQMMSMCWKYLTPISFVCIFGTMTWMLVVDWDTPSGLATRFVMAGLGSVALIYYAYRVVEYYRSDARTYERMTGLKLWYPPTRLP